jgi:hypothetical protein
MEQKTQLLTANSVISMSKSTKEKIAAVAKTLKGKELFPEKVEHARKTLSNLKSFPI